MIMAHTRPIHMSVGKDKTLLEAFVYLKELKIWTIQKALKDAQVLGFIPTCDDIESKVSHKYIGALGAYMIMVEGKELMYIQPAEHKTNDKQEIECSFGYKLLYMEEV